MSRDRRKEIVESEHPRLSLTRQCDLLQISRSSWYYAALGESAPTLELMRRMDEQFMKTLEYGARQMARHLRRQGYWVNRKRVRRLMQKMGLMAMYQKSNTSKPHPDHKVHPYLLRGLDITEPNQVWCSDISYIPMRRGFLYLVAIMDWASRKVLSWRLSNTMEADFCVAALKEVLGRYGSPESSIQIKAASSRAQSSHRRSKTQGLKYLWMVRVVGWTMSWLNGYGDH